MGVQGLTSFIDENPVLLRDYRLHDTRVLIDGNNLCYFLYYNYYNINMRYGGDYDVYADSLRRYFSTLKSCNIDPYVIFDGAYEQDNRKLRTIMNRSGQRLMQATRVANGKSGHILPLLCFETFQCVLGEIEVNHMRCDFEADDQLAVLANEWGCPVMSNDSDFFIFNLKGGFIIFDYLNLEIKEDEKDNVPYKYLNVQIYYLSTLLSFYEGLDHERIALFANLTGNDYVDRATFNNFFSQAKFPDPSGHKLTTARRHYNKASLLMWLQAAQDLESAVAAISSFIPTKKQNSVRGLLLKSVRSYTCIDSNLKEYFTGGECKTKDLNSWKTYANNVFPDWLVGCLRRSEIPLFVLNLLVTRRLVFLCQVEIINNQSSFKCAQYLQRVLLSILATLDEPSLENVTDHGSYVVDVYDREKKTMKWKKVGTLSKLHDGSPIPDISTIPELNGIERERILLASLGVSADTLQEIPTVFRLLVAIMAYWVRHAQPSVTVLHVYSLALSAIKLSLVSDSAKTCTGGGGGGTGHQEAGTGKQEVEVSCASDQCRGNFTSNEEVPSELQGSKEPATRKAVSHGKTDPAEVVSKTEEQTVENNNRLSDVDNKSLISDSPIDLSDKPHRMVGSPSVGPPPGPSSPSVGQPPGPSCEAPSPSVWHLPKSVHQELKHFCDDRHYKFALNNLEKFTEESKRYERSQFKTTIIHGFAQFQTCLQASLYLNMLLRCPVPCLAPPCIYNGTFLYNLTVELQRWVDPKSYIFGQLGRKSPLCDLWIKMVDAVISAVPATSFATIKEGFKLGKKEAGSKVTTTTQKKPSESYESDNNTCEEEDGADDKLGIVNATCSLTNRFSGLLLDDS